MSQHRAGGRRPRRRRRRREGTTRPRAASSRCRGARGRLRRPRSRGRRVRDPRPGRCWRLLGLLAAVAGAGYHSVRYCRWMPPDCASP
ncbi:MAG: hypothetical protein M0C28_11255 [Candidatus Moduliflexus flocculans]|nr:hypothetical protein [Candidatus Moduliflexus flocculans]